MIAGQTNDLAWQQDGSFIFGFKKVIEPDLFAWKHFASDVNLFLSAWLTGESWVPPSSDALGARVTRLRDG